MPLTSDETTNDARRRTTDATTHLICCRSTPRVCRNRTTSDAIGVAGEPRFADHDPESEDGQRERTERSDREPPPRREVAVREQERHEDQDRQDADDPPDVRDDRDDDHRQTVSRSVENEPRQDLSAQESERGRCRCCGARSHVETESETTR